MNRLLYYLAYLIILPERLYTKAWVIYLNDGNLPGSFYSVTNPESVAKAKSLIDLKLSKSKSNVKRS